MGRRKIQIAPITDDRNRTVTFQKRKNGLFKKAHELGVLCKSDVAVIIFGNNNKLYEFCSGDMDSVLYRYSQHEGTSNERRGPDDYSSGKRPAAGSADKDEDDEEESASDFGDDIEPTNAKPSNLASSAHGRQESFSRQASNGRLPPPSVPAPPAAPPPMHPYGAHGQTFPQYMPGIPPYLAPPFPGSEHFQGLPPALPGQFPQLYQPNMYPPPAQPMPPSTLPQSLPNLAGQRSNVNTASTQSTDSSAPNPLLPHLNPAPQNPQEGQKSMHMTDTLAMQAGRYLQAMQQQRQGLSLPHGTQYESAGSSPATAQNAGPSDQAGSSPAAASTSSATQFSRRHPEQRQDDMEGHKEDSDGAREHDAVLALASAAAPTSSQQTTPSAPTSGAPLPPTNADLGPDPRMNHTLGSLFSDYYLTPYINNDGSVLPPMPEQDTFTWPTINNSRKRSGDSSTAGDQVGDPKDEPSNSRPLRNSNGKRRNLGSQPNSG